MNMKDNETIGLKTIIVRYALHWRLFLASFLFSFILAVLYLLCYPRTYEVMARIQIQDDKELGGGSFGLGEAAGMMKSFGLGGFSGESVNLEDELQTLTSNQLLREMVLALGIQVEYSEPFTFGYRLYEGSPVRMTTDSLTESRLDEEIEFVVSMESGRVDISAESGSFKKKKFSFSSLPASIELPMGTFVLDYTAGKADFTTGKLSVNYRPAGWVAEDLSDEFLIEETSKSSNTIELSCRDYEKKRGKDMLTTLISLYNKQADSYKKEGAHAALGFFDGRIRDLLGELADVERRISEYKHKNALMDIEHDVAFYVDQMKELQTQLIAREAQLNVIDMIDGFIKDPANRYNLVPVLLSAQNGETGGSLSNYNKVLLERSRVIQNSSLNNPLVGVLTEQADLLRDNVRKTVGNTRKGLQLSVADIKSKEKLIYDKMNAYPLVERQFVELKRQQEVNQGVYLVLLQKREEAALVLGQARDKAKVIDTAFVKSKPVGPRKLYAAIGLLLFTLIVPIFYLFFKGQIISLCELYRTMR